MINLPTFFYLSPMAGLLFLPHKFSTQITYFSLCGCFCFITKFSQDHLFVDLVLLFTRVWWAHWKIVSQRKWHPCSQNLHCSTMRDGTFRQLSPLCLTIDRHHSPADHAEANTAGVSLWLQFLCHTEDSISEPFSPFSISDILSPSSFTVFL